MIDVARTQALQAMLGQTPSIATGDALPPFAHHIYFWDPQTPDVLGQDGHPATGQFIPDMGGTRRMWAAGKLVFHRPLLAGIRAEKTSTIEGVTRKDGRSGPLAFVRVRHDIRQRQTLALTEWQELAYRVPPPATTVPPPQASTDETISEQVTFDSTLLFRYSALTFNGHRIHYDEIYARDVEGYAGLVVHGPLLAHLLMGLAQRQLGGLQNFFFLPCDIATYALRGCDVMLERRERMGARPRWAAMHGRRGNLGYRLRSGLKSSGIVS